MLPTYGWKPLTQTPSKLVELYFPPLLSFSHRDFGRNLTLKDVTDDKAVLEVVDNFSKKKKKTQHDQRKAINA